MPWRTTFAVQSGGNHSGVQKKLLIASVAVAVIALAGSGALYGYDVSRSDVIAKGVSIGPLDVSGLSAHSARRLIRAPLAALAASDRPAGRRGAGRERGARRRPPRHVHRPGDSRSAR